MTIYSNIDDLDSRVNHFIENGWGILGDSKFIYTEKYSNREPTHYFVQTLVKKIYRITEKPTCKTCTHFFFNNGHSWCRRYAPGRSVVSYNTNSHQEMGPDGYCGEHPDSEDWIEYLKSQDVKYNQDLVNYNKKNNEHI